MSIISLPHLSVQIKKSISSRILISIFILLSSLLGLIIYDIKKNIDVLESKLYHLSSRLNEFLISQILIDNRESIKFEINNASKSNEMLIVWFENQSLAKNKPQMRWSFPFIWTYYDPVIAIDGNKFGVIRIKSSLIDNTNIAQDIIFQFSLLFMPITLIIFLLMPLTNKIPKALFFYPIITILELLTKRTNYSERDLLFYSKTQEVYEIMKKIIEIINNEKNLVEERVLLELSAQITHDIQSPLAMLKLLQNDFARLPDDNKLVIRNAINRIQNISNKITKRQKELYLNDEVFLLEVMISDILEEKKILFKEKIKFILDKKESGSIFIKGDETEIGRVLSNVINNAEESIIEFGEINISLDKDEFYAQIKITDNGVGISKDNQKKLFSKGFSFGKKFGSGLGLSHAKYVVERSGGNIDITSEENTGTTVNINLPLSIPPSWLRKDLKFVSGAHIIILDDEKAIHDLWDSYLRTYIENLSISIHYFYSFNELEIWKINNDNLVCLYLLDYEIVNENTTGVDFILTHNISIFSTLVTGRFRDRDILDRCQKNNIKILPKALIDKVSIEIIDANKSIEAILIDDDVDLHACWKVKGKLVNKRVLTFSTPDEFFQVINFINLNVPIYIDSNLGLSMLGQEYAKTIFNFGFHTIYLCTGDSNIDIHSLEWIKSVVNKSPPF